MMRSRIGRCGAVVAAIGMFMIAARFGVGFVQSGDVLYGIVIIASFAIMLICVLFLAVKSILDGEQAAYRERGRELGRVRCSMDMRDLSRQDGEAVFYERCVAYESGGSEADGIIPYRQFSCAMQDGDAVMLFPVMARKGVLTIETDSVLRARAVMNLLTAGGVREKR